MAVVPPIIMAVVPPIIAAVVPPIIAAVVPPIIPQMPVVLTTNVMTVDPFVMVPRPMARHPNHFPVIIPVRSAVIERPISDLYADPPCTGERRKKSDDDDKGYD